jgi:DNA-binding LacI/PurR family transcriptional regulator
MSVRIRSTYEDVAARANVSVATVSRVINGQGNVSDTTREKVLEAVRILRSNDQKLVIGLIIPDTSNPFFSELSFDFGRECERKGAILFTSSSEGSASREIDLIESFERMDVDGLVFITTGQSGAESLLNVLTNKGVDSFPMPMVVFDRALPIGGFDYVSSDSSGGTLAAVDYLLTCGHKNIAYLTGLDGTETAEDRLEAFEIAMAKNKLTLDQSFVFRGDFQAASGKRCADEILALPQDNRPSALLCANDIMAIAAMQRFQERGLSVPHDISIVGFDDINACEWVYPKLTTIGQQTEKLASDALRLLLKRIEQRKSSESYTPQAICTKPILVPRQSVGKPRKALGQTLKLVVAKAE